jgi:hypothetical protein
MKSILRTLSIVLASTAVVGTTSFPTTLTPPQVRADQAAAAAAPDLETGMCYPAAPGLRA